MRSTRVRRFRQWSARLADAGSLVQLATTLHRYPNDARCARDTLRYAFLRRTATPQRYTFRIPTFPPIVHGA